MRGFFLAACLAVLGAGAASADIFDLFPFLNRSDPRVRSLETFVTVPIELSGETIAVFPFALEQPGEPRPPDPAPVLVDALHWYVPQARAALLEARPEDLRAMAAAAGSIHAGLAVDGRAHSIFRRPGGGLYADVTVRLLDVRGEAPKLLWSAHKRFRWRKRYPTYECLLLLAESVVFNWLEYAPSAGGDEAE